MAKDYTVSSPNGKISATVNDGNQITISHQGKTVLTVRPAIVSGKETIGFSAGNNKFLGKKQLSESISSPLYRQASFKMEGQQMDVRLGKNI